MHLQTRAGSLAPVLAALLAALLLAGGAAASRPLARLQPGVLSASSQGGPEGEEELNLRPLIGVVSQVGMGRGQCTWGVRRQCIPPRSRQQHPGGQRRSRC